MAMALFAIAAVSLAQALNTISLTVIESIEGAEIEEQLRGVLMEVSRDPNIQEDTRTISGEEGISFQVEIERLSLSNEEAIPLEDLFEVRVTALRKLPGKKSEEIASADTWVFEGMF